MIARPSGRRDTGSPGDAPTESQHPDPVGHLPWPSTRRDAKTALPSGHPRHCHPQLGPRVRGQCHTESAKHAQDPRPQPSGHLAHAEPGDHPEGGRHAVSPSTLGPSRPSRAGLLASGCQCRRGHGEQHSGLSSPHADPHRHGPRLPIDHYARVPLSASCPS